MNNWKLDVNVSGDISESKVMLNGAMFTASKARLCLCAGDAPHLVLEIPIDGVSNTIDLGTNTNECIDQLIEATSINKDVK